MSIAFSHPQDVQRRTATSTPARTPALVGAGAVAAGVLAVAVFADRALWPYAGAAVLVAIAFVLVTNRGIAATPEQSMQFVVAGERRTARALEPLRTAGWSITPGISCHEFNDGGTIDHLVFGPNGPFVIETKTVTGAVRVSRGMVSITPPGAERPDFPSDAWGYEARSIAAEAHQLIKQQTGTATPVRAVVVIWGTFAQRCVSGRNVTFIHGDDLGDWLLAQSAHAA